MPNLNVHQSACSSSLTRVLGCFNQCFTKPFNTVLVGGADEPLYQPSTNGLAPHQIYFRSDYLASALHEAAHWCIAGEGRRGLEDYGYWYSPDGRSQDKQALFEKVEAKPQALEWIFSRACNQPFRISADNVEACVEPSDDFKDNIVKHARDFCENAMPARGLCFAEALAAEFNALEVFRSETYLRSYLR
jgi:elongation factor P hydroxylase